MTTLITSTWRHEAALSLYACGLMVLRGGMLWIVNVMQLQRRKQWHRMEDRITWEGAGEGAWHRRGHEGAAYGSLWSAEAWCRMRTRPALVLTCLELGWKIGIHESSGRYDGTWRHSVDYACYFYIFMNKVMGKKYELITTLTPFVSFIIWIKKYIFCDLGGGSSVIHNCRLTFLNKPVSVHCMCVWRG